MQIGAAVTLTRLACATCHDRRLVVRILSLFNEDSALGFYALKPQPAVDHTPFAAVERAVTRIAGWRHAVEDIRTVCDGFNDEMRALFTQLSKIASLDNAKKGLAMAIGRIRRAAMHFLRLH